MELKFPNCVAAQMGLYGSNCTFMELKYVLQVQQKEQKHRSNCTFMELKYCRNHTEHGQQQF